MNREEINKLQKENEQLQKDLSCKTQEYNDLFEQHKELDNRANRMIEEKYNLCGECEELKYKVKKLRKNIVLEIETSDRYRKALEEIEEIVSKDYYDDTWADISIKLDEILDIINKTKGE